MNLIAWTPPIPGPLLRLRFFGYDLDDSGYFDVAEYKKVIATLGQLKTDRQFAFYDKGPFTYDVLPEGGVVSNKADDGTDGLRVHESDRGVKFCGHHM